MQRDPEGEQQREQPEDREDDEERRDERVAGQLLAARPAAGSGADRPGRCRPALAVSVLTWLLPLRTGSAGGCDVEAAARRPSRERSGHRAERSVCRGLGVLDRSRPSRRRTTPRRSRRCAVRSRPRRAPAGSSRRGRPARGCWRRPRRSGRSGASLKYSFVVSLTPGPRRASGCDGRLPTASNAAIWPSALVRNSTSSIGEVLVLARRSGPPGTSRPSCRRRRAPMAMSHLPAFAVAGLLLDVAGHPGRAGDGGEAAVLEAGVPLVGEGLQLGADPGVDHRERRCPRPP